LKPKPTQEVVLYLAVDTMAPSENKIIFFRG